MFISIEMLAKKSKSSKSASKNRELSGKVIISKSILGSVSGARGGGARPKSKD
ncbi:hypothetical protein J8L98_11540 [Pseudoalteromonas sp. MMG013]|nr:hypothetical protein [Pseudoalteromonas sp. MMG013]